MSGRGREQLLVFVVVVAMLAVFAAVLLVKLLPVLHAVGRGFS